MTIMQELWPGGPQFKEGADCLRVGADSVLLADFAVKAKIKKKRAIDLGCGSGIIAVLLALRDPLLHVDAIDILPHAVRLASENAALAGASDRITAIEGDLRRHREFMQNGGYDMTVSNPPYYRQGSGKAPEIAALAAARDDALCTLDDLCRAASYLTRWSGSFIIAHRPEHLPAIFRALSVNGLEPKRMRFVHHSRQSPPYLVLIDSRRGGKPSLSVEPPLIMVNDDGSDTDEVKAIYNRG